MKYLGLYWVKGTKNYNQPFRRLNSHATFVFESEEHYFFINLSSLKEFQARDTLRINDKPYTFNAKDVFVKNVKQFYYPLNLITLVPRVDKETVITPFQDGTSRVEIIRKYKCSNEEELTKKAFSLIFEQKSQFYVFNGNDDDYQYKDFEDENSKLPSSLIKEIQDYINKKSSS